MLVRDKSREIGILRTIGANRGMILRIFFISGASIGTIGTITGCFLGLIFSYNIDFIRHLLQNLTGTELFSAEIYFLSHLPSKVLIFHLIFWHNIAWCVHFSNNFWSAIPKSFSIVTNNRIRHFYLSDQTPTSAVPHPSP